MSVDYTVSYSYTSSKQITSGLCHVPAARVCMQGASSTARTLQGCDGSYSQRCRLQHPHLRHPLMAAPTCRSSRTIGRHPATCRHVSLILCLQCSLSCKAEMCVLNVCHISEFSVCFIYQSFQTSFQTSLQNARLMCMSYKRDILPRARPCMKGACISGI